jgi:hypothetical protein
VKLPSGLAPGLHHVIATGVGTNNEPLTSNAAFVVDNSGHFLASASSSTNVSGSSSPPATRKTVYHPTADKKHVVTTFAASFALMSVIGGVGIAGMAAAGAGGAGGAGGSGGGRSGHGSHRHSEKVSSAKVKHHKLKWEGQAPGDTSWTWRLAGWAWLDRISRDAPVKTAPAVPLAARLMTDASYLRAMFGVASLVLPAAGAVLGVAAGVANGASTLPPSLGFLLGITVLGTFDAAAGFIAAAGFALTVTVQGALTDAASVRMLLGLCVLWFAVPLIAGAARPLRRPVGDLDASEVWTRIADLVVASLIGAWAAQKIVGTFPALAVVKLSVTSHENLIGIVVLLLIVARFALETLCSFLYPERLATVSPAKLPYSTPNQRLASLAFRTAMFVFVAIAYLGDCWELWAGAAIFAIPQVLKIYENKFPNHKGLFKLLPGGILKTVAMLFIGKWFFQIFSSHVSSQHLLAYGFVVLALPATGISLVEIVGREGESRTETWVHQLAGVAILILGVLFVLGKIS